jgi:hypothetical protein
MATKKRAPADSELARLLDLAASDPKAALAEVKHLRERALTVEAAAVRAALEAENWLVAPAAARLGLPRHTTLVRMLAGRLRDVGGELAAMRDKRGYSGGNPAPMRSNDD